MQFILNNQTNNFLCFSLKWNLCCSLDLATTTEANPNNLVNIIDKHGWFNDLSKSTKSTNMIFQDRFNKYLHENSKDVISLLYNSTGQMIADYFSKPLECVGLEL